MSNVTLLRLTLAFLISLFSSGVFAQETPQYAVSTAPACGGQTLLLNGSGIRTVSFLGIRIYRGSLFVAAPSSDAAALLALKTPRLMRFEFLRSASAERVQSGWREGLRKNAPSISEAALNDFVKLLPGAEEGSVIEICIHDDTASLSLNGAEIGRVTDAGAANSLLSVWLGAHPPSDELKSGILSNR